MKEKIVIVGQGSSIPLHELRRIGHDDVTIVSPEEAKKLQLPKHEPIKITAPPMLHSHYDGKQFICKGKHEYRKNKDGKWKCQCGREV